MASNNNGNLIGTLAQDPDKIAGGVRIKLAVGGYDPATRSRKVNTFNIFVPERRQDFVLRFGKEGSSFAVQYHLDESGIVADDVGFASTKLPGTAPAHTRSYGAREEEPEKEDNGFSF